MARRRRGRGLHPIRAVRREVRHVLRTSTRKAVAAALVAAGASTGGAAATDIDPVGALKDTLVSVLGSNAAETPR